MATDSAAQAASVWRTLVLLVKGRQVVLFMLLTVLVASVFVYLPYSPQIQADFWANRGRRRNGSDAVNQIHCGTGAVQDKETRAICASAAGTSALALSVFNMFSSTVSTAVVAPILGRWGDAVGRKAPMIVCLFLIWFEPLTLYLHVVTRGSVSLLWHYSSLALGGYSLLMTVLSAYMCDISTPSRRAQRSESQTGAYADMDMTERLIASDDHNPTCYRRQNPSPLPRGSRTYVLTLNALFIQVGIIAGPWLSKQLNSEYSCIEVGVTSPLALAILIVLLVPESNRLAPIGTSLVDSVLETPKKLWRLASRSEPEDGDENSTLDQSSQRTGAPVASSKPFEELLANANLFRLLVANCAWGAAVVSMQGINSLCVSGNPGKR